MPDFAQYYGLRLTEVVAEYEPCEAVVLIAGLPGTSRYAARQAGEATGGGWGTSEWLALDTRNAIEGLRATVVAMGDKKKRNEFREWEHYPGRESEKKRQTADKLGRFRLLASELKD